MFALLLWALAYVVLGRLGMIFVSLPPGNLTLLWLPSGIGLVMFLLYGRRALPWIFLASAGVNAPALIGATPEGKLWLGVVTAAGSALLDTAQAVIGRWLWQGGPLLPAGPVGRRAADPAVAGQTPMDQLAMDRAAALADALRWTTQSFRRFLLGAVVAAPLLTCPVIVALLWSGGYLDDPEHAAGLTQPLRTAALISVADAQGIFLLLPLITLLLAGTDERLPRARTLRQWSFWLLPLPLLLALQWPVAVFLSVPLLVHLAMQCGFRGSVAGFTVLAAGVTVLVTNNVRVFAGENGDVAAFTEAAVFLIGNGLPLLLLGLSIDELQRSNATLEARVQQRTGSLLHANQQLLTLAQTDALTGLPNRRACQEQLQALLGAGGDNCVLMLDLDHFKAINDSRGHPFGDRVLQSLSRRWQQQLRQGDVLARWGGEEFVVLLPGLDRDQGRDIAERLRLCGQQADGDIPAMTVSIGLVSVQPGETADALLARADAALYLAKKSGRDRVVVGESS